MALDPNISLSYKPTPLENPANQLAQIYQLNQAQQQNQLNQLKMQDYQRESEERNMLRGIDPASSDYINKLKRINPKLGFEAEKELRLGQKAQTDAVGERIKLSRQALDGVQTPEQFLAWHQQNHADPILGEYLKSRGVTAEQSAAKIAEALKTPDGFQKLLTESKIGSEKALENHFANQDLGGTSRVLTMPKYGSGPAAVVAGSVGKESLTPYQTQQLALEGRRVTAAEAKANETPESKLKQPPVHAQKAIMGAAQAVKKIDDAIALLEATPDATGYKGYLPNMVLNRAYPEGTEARAAIADIGSLELHDRSGAAVTASEYPRQVPFIPTINDDKETTLKKLKRMRQIQLDDTEAFNAAYVPEQGFREFKVPTIPSAQKPSREASGKIKSKVDQIPSGAPQSASSDPLGIR